MSKKPKILVISTTDNWGGAAKIGWSLGKSLRAKGYSVKYLVSRKYSHVPYVNALDSSRMHCLSMLLRYARTFATADDIHAGTSAKIFAHPWYQEADIVHCHNLHGSFFDLDALVRIGREKKLVWTLHDLWVVGGDVAYGIRHSIWDYPPMLWNNAKSLRLQKKRILQKTNLTLVAPSHWLEKQIKAKLGAHTKKIRWIQNGIETQAHPRLELIKNKQFLFIGNPHDARKGWSFAKAAVDRVPGASLTTINRMLTSEERHMRFANVVALLAPSLEENAPLTILEAMDAGLPIVTFGVGGIPEIVIHKENGYVARPHDLIDLAKGLSWVLTRTDKERLRIGQKNQARIRRHFSLKKMSDAYENLYNQL